MDRGDIWTMDLGPVRGREQPGLRPVLILSTEHFHKTLRLALIAPITTSGTHTRDAGFSVPIQGYGLTTNGVVRCDHIRVVDPNVRNAIYRERVPDEIVDLVAEKIGTILE